MILFLIVFSVISPFLLVFLPQIKRKLLFILLLSFLVFKDLLTILIPSIAGGLIRDEVLVPMFTIQSLYFFILTIILLIFAISVNQLRIFKNSYNYRIKTVWIILLISITVLIINSGGVWLINPRLGYQNYRAGVGIFWVLYVSCVSLLIAYHIERKKFSRILLIVVIILLYYSGSKYLTLVGVISYTFYLVWNNKKILNFNSIVFSIVTIVLFMVQFGQFGGDESFYLRMLEYMDFVRNAKLVYKDYYFGQLDFEYGRIFTSSFWSYVPRGLINSKPYVYGPIILLENYYPGLAETGHTPSFGFLTAEFVDFWYFGALFAFVLNPVLLLKLYSVIIVSKKNIHDVGTLPILIALVPSFGFHLPFFLQVLLLGIVLKR